MKTFIHYFLLYIAMGFFLTTTGHGETHKTKSNDSTLAEPKGKVSVKVVYEDGSPVDCEVRLSFNYNEKTSRWDFPLPLIRNEETGCHINDRVPVEDGVELTLWVYGANDSFDNKIRKTFRFDKKNMNKHFDIVVYPSIRGRMVGSKTGTQSTNWGMTLFQKINEKWVMKNVGRLNKKGEFTLVNLEKGEYYLLVEEYPPGKVRGVSPFKIDSGEPRDLTINMVELSREDMKEKYPVIYSCFQDKKKEIETFLLSGECLTNGGCLHDVPMKLCEYGDIYSVPVLIKVLKAIEKMYPSEEGLIICTHEHCVFVLRFLSGEDLGLNSKDWEEWWKKKEKELKQGERKTN